MATITTEQKIFGILAYLGILVLIPLLVKKDDDFVHFHAKQGLILLLIWIIIWVITFIPIMGWILGPLLSVAGIILVIIAIVKVLMGEKWEIPVVSTYADKINM